MIIIVHSFLLCQCVLYMFFLLFIWRKKLNIVTAFTSAAAAAAVDADDDERIRVRHV